MTNRTIRFIHAQQPESAAPTSLRAVPNPRGNQTLAQPQPAVPRTSDGRFTPEFRPAPRAFRPARGETSR